MIPLLLTATVNPQGMVGAAFSPEERAHQYALALSFYVPVLHEWWLECGEEQAIVFAENSDANPQLVLQDVPTFEGVQIEYLRLDTDGFRQDKGKGFNEVLLLHKAVLASKVIAQTGCFFKLTGRLKLMNVLALLRECQKLQRRPEGLEFLADCKDHKVYERLHLPINGHAGECRYWFASTQAFENLMAPRYAEMNDYSTPPVLAEDLMLDVCRKVDGKPGFKVRFRTQARISGRGGHDLGKGLSFFYSTDNDSWALRMKAGLRQVLRWVLPHWKV